MVKIKPVPYHLESSVTFVPNLALGVTPSYREKKPKNNKPYTSEFLTVMAADHNYISCCHSSIMPVLKDILL